jgi:hypothetical protein
MGTLFAVLTCVARVAPGTGCERGDGRHRCDPKQMVHNGGPAPIGLRDIYANVKVFFSRYRCLLWGGGFSWLTSNTYWLLPPLLS